MARDIEQEERSYSFRCIVGVATRLQTWSRTQSSRAAGETAPSTVTG